MFTITFVLGLVTQCEGNPGWAKLYEKATSLILARVAQIEAVTLSVPKSKRLFFYENPSFLDQKSSEAGTFTRTLHAITWEVDTLWKGRRERWVKTLEIGQPMVETGEHYILSLGVFNKDWVKNVEGAEKIVDISKPVPILTAFAGCNAFWTLALAREGNKGDAMRELSQFPRWQFETNGWRRAPRAK